MASTSSGNASGSQQPHTEADKGKAPKKAKRATNTEVLDKLEAMMSKFRELEKHVEQQERRGSTQHLANSYHQWTSSRKTAMCRQKWIST